MKPHVGNIHGNTACHDFYAELLAARQVDLALGKSEPDAGWRSSRELAERCESVCSHTRLFEVREQLGAKHQGCGDPACLCARLRLEMREDRLFNYHKGRMVAVHHYRLAWFCEADMARDRDSAVCSTAEGAVTEGGVSARERTGSR